MHSPFPAKGEWCLTKQIMAALWLKFLWDFLLANKKKKKIFLRWFSNVLRSML